MKLWQVIQWGNKEEGPNGLDTQCIVSAANMEDAIAKGEFHFNQYASWKQADTKVLCQTKGGEHYATACINNKVCPGGFDALESSNDTILLVKCKPTKDVQSQ